jgi:hypothetical protein
LIQIIRRLAHYHNGVKLGGGLRRPVTETDRRDR